MLDLSTIGNVNQLIQALAFHGYIRTDSDVNQVGNPPSIAPDAPFWGWWEPDNHEGIRCVVGIYPQGTWHGESVGLQVNVATDGRILFWEKVEHYVGFTDLMTDEELQRLSIQPPDISKFLSDWYERIPEEVYG